MLNVKSIGLVSAPILFILTLISPLEMNYEAKVVLAITLWMSVWWITEAIPIYATALLPLILIPLFGVAGIEEVASSYSDNIIFLLLGGFMIAVAIEKTRLHERFALNIIKIFGSKPQNIIGGFIITTTMLSAWISNTATTLMMLPIAASILPHVRNEDERRALGSRLMLSIAYAASIGGVATLIGTPPNAVFASLASSLLNIDIGFGEWLVIGLPTTIISIGVLWLYMTRLRLSISTIEERGIILEKLKEIGHMNRDEKVVALLFGSVIIAWISRSLIWGEYLPILDDSIIALIGAVILFLLPSSKGERILDWHTAVKIPWGVLILLGGGLALASAYTTTGLDKWIAESLLSIIPAEGLLMIIIVTFTVFVTEIMSNTATASLLIPIGFGIATTLEIDPLPIMAIIAIASSHSFMLPISTPPNSIVFGSGYVTVKEMVKVGFMLDIFYIITLTLSGLFLIPLIWYY